MKKKFAIAFVLATILGLTIVGAALAQDGNPPFGGRGPGDGSGFLHDYIEKALADAVGLPFTEFESRHDSGETFYLIALSEGYQAEEIPALMEAAHGAALDAAAANGLVTQEQANWMKSRGFGRGGMMLGGGYGTGDCPMFDGDEAPSGQFGSGMMGGGRGGRWQQDGQ